MAPRSKFFRVAVEGATATDGREITRDWIDQMAAGYDRATYGARVNMEHIRGFSAEPPFNAYGDVLALEARDVDLTIDGKVEKRRALYAQIDPTDALVKLTKDRQKIYTSIEVAPNFANTGKAGLVGLAVTDSPASLGTDILQFAASNPALKGMFDGRKLAPENAFSAACETSIELEAEQAAGEGAGSVAAFFAELRKVMFGQGQDTSTQASGGAAKPPVTPAAGPSSQAQPAGGDQSFAAFAVAFGGLQAAIESDAKRRDDQFAALKGEVDTLVGKLKTTEDHSTRRPAATGGAAGELTDC